MDNKTHVLHSSSGNFSSIQNDTVGNSIPSSNNRYYIDLEDDVTNCTSYIAFGKGIQDIYK